MADGQTPPPNVSFTHFIKKNFIVPEMAVHLNKSCL